MRRERTDGSKKNKGRKEEKESGRNKTRERVDLATYARMGPMFADEGRACVSGPKCTYTWGTNETHVDKIQDEAPGAVRLMKLMRTVVLNPLRPS